MIDILVGDAATVLKTLGAQTIQSCVTSPPYFGLRDYGVEGQVGLESRAPEYVNSLVCVFAEVWHVLRDDGVLFVNIGDTSASFKDGKFPPHSQSEGAQRSMPTSNAPHRQKRLLELDGFRDKETMGIPWRFAFAMRDAGWRLRQELIWAKPNYTPEKVRDRFVRSHETIFMFTKKPNYFFDGDAIRVPNGTGGTKLPPNVLTTPVSRYNGAHFATYPPDLIRPLIVGSTRVGDTVLDPFAGSGTTGVVCKQEGRNAVLVELNPEYAELARERVSL